MVFYKETVMINVERAISQGMEDITDTLKELSRWTLVRLFHRKYKLIKQYNLQIYKHSPCVSTNTHPHIYPPLGVL